MCDLTAYHQDLFQLKYSLSCFYIDMYWLAVYPYFWQTFLRISQPLLIAIQTLFHIGTNTGAGSRHHHAGFVPLSESQWDSVAILLYRYSTIQWVFFIYSFLHMTCFKYTMGVKIFMKKLHIHQLESNELKH